MRYTREASQPQVRWLLVDSGQHIIALSRDPRFTDGPFAVYVNVATLSSVCNEQRDDVREDFSSRWRRIALF